MKKGPPLNIMGFDRFVYPALKTNRNAFFFYIYTAGIYCTYMYMYNRKLNSYSVYNRSHLMTQIKFNINFRVPKIIIPSFPAHTPIIVIQELS